MTAPSSPPLNVQVTEVTNSSVTVTWDHPVITNGVLKYYEVRCNDISRRVEPKAETTVSYFENVLLGSNYHCMFFSTLLRTCRVTKNAIYPL